MPDEHSIIDRGEEIPSRTIDSRAALLDPRKKRRAPCGFQCGEYLDRSASSHASSVSFYCTVPSGESEIRLTFSCRDRTVGVLEGAETNLTSDDMEETAQDESNVDPNFFDEGYTLAGRTGFQVWAATRILIESLIFPMEGDCQRLLEIQQQLRNAKSNVLELGAGVGVVSTSLAASLGVNALLTDLPTLVEFSILPNLKQNATESATAAVTQPQWLCDASKNQVFEEEDFDDVVYPIGSGWTSTCPVDWTKPLSADVTSVLHEVDWVICGDCIWLTSMLKTLLETVKSIFRTNPKTRLLISFQRRDTSGDNPMFTKLETILDAIEEFGGGLNVWHGDIRK